MSICDSATNQMTAQLGIEGWSVHFKEMHWLQNGATTLPRGLKWHLIKLASGRSSTPSKATNEAKSTTEQLQAKHYKAQ